MNNHPPPPLIHRPTTTQILNQTTAVIFTHHHLLPILILSLFLLAFRNEMENTTDSLITLTDNDPSFKSLFPLKPITHQNRRHVTRDNDEDFFIDKINQRFFGNSFTSKPQSNSTPIILDSFNARLGYSSSELSFKTIKTNNSNDSVSVNDRKTEIVQQDSTVLLAIGKFAVSYGYMFFLYVASQSFLHGTTFVLVVNHILRKHSAFRNTYRKGVILGSKRVLWLIILRWFLMHSLFQILSVWFNKCEDGYAVFKILVRLKFLPFSIGFTRVLSWVKGFEKEIFGFMLFYISLDIIISYLFGVCVWVAMADSRKTFSEVIRNAFHLLLLLINPAVYLKCLENIVSCSFTKFILSQVFGEFLASFIQSLMVIFVMVAWMMYYFSLRLLDANLRGVGFGRRAFARMLKDD